MRLLHVNFLLSVAIPWKKWDKLLLLKLLLISKKWNVVLLFKAAYTSFWLCLTWSGRSTVYPINHACIFCCALILLWLYYCSKWIPVVGLPLILQGYFTGTAAITWLRGIITPRVPELKARLQLTNPSDLPCLDGDGIDDVKFLRFLPKTHCWHRGWWYHVPHSSFLVIIMLLMYSVLHCLYSVGNKMTTTTIILMAQCWTTVIPVC